MKPGEIVDLSDDTKVESERKKLDRKRFNEIKKYIPFLEYITSLDPIKNEKYVKLLHWFKSNKNLPARVASTCEFAINRRFTTLKASMNFPPNIIAIFEGQEEAIDLVSDDDDDDQQSSTSNNVSSTTKQNINNDPEASTSSKIKPNSIVTSINIEEGELLSDSDGVVDVDEKRKNTQNASQLKTPLDESPVVIIDHDDVINQDLFNRIDDHEGDKEKQAVTPSFNEKNQDKEVISQRKKSPILTPKNDESLCRKSPDYLSNISDDDNEPFKEIVVKHKKKKKNKNKNRTEQQCCPQDENRNDSTKKNKKNSKKRKKKKLNSRPFYISDDDEDDQSNQTDNTFVELVEKPETELFQRREPAKIEKSTPATSSHNPITLVLLDSDEDEINSSTKKEVSKIEPIAIVKSPPLSDEKTISPQPSQEAKTEKKIEPPSPAKIKDLSSMGLNELNDIYAKLCEKTGIQLEELLGDLLNKSSLPEKDDSVTIIDDKTIPQQSESDLNKNDTVEEYRVNYNLQNEQLLQQQQQHLQQQQMYQQQQLQQQQQQFNQQHQGFQNHMHYSPNHAQHNQQLPYSYQNSLMPRLNLNDPRIVQKLKQIKDSPIHNLSIRESATLLMNSCATRPNFANRTQPPPPPPPVTSVTATTYGEHKRLKELEKQESERKAKQIKEINKAPPNKNATENSSSSLNSNNKDSLGSDNAKTMEKQMGKASANEINAEKSQKRTNSSDNERARKTSKSPTSESEKSRKSPNFRKDSSDLESVKVRNTSKSPTSEREKNRKSPSDSEITRKRKTSKSRTLSSDFESDENSQKSKADKEEDNENVVMSFAGNSKKRNRMPSTSSSSTNDFVEESLSSIPLTKNSELKKVLKIVMSALKDNKEDTQIKSLNNSTRKSTDSRRSKSKSPHPNSAISVEENENKDENAEESLGAVKKGKPKSKRVRRKTNENLGESPPKSKPTQTKRCNRELENLNCTFREYRNMFEKCLLPNNDGKRLCSSKKPLAYGSSDNIYSDAKEKSSDSKVVRPAPIGRRRQTCSWLQTSTNKRDRRLSDEGKFSDKRTPAQESSDETDEFDIEEHQETKADLKTTYKNINEDPFDPVLKVILNKLTDQEIMKYVKYENHKEEKQENNTHAPKHVFGEKPILVPFSSKPVSASKKATPKPPSQLNNNINMTLNSTKTCVLCNKRPNDLINHYIVQHQTESYTSRLTAKEIENLETNITIAVRHRNRYKVICPFCQVLLEDNFVNFHAHFSFHTGEYGFKCAVCDLVKPYREDIRSHQYRTSSCLNGKIRSNYLYSPDLVVIYLYVCNLCNFVQLNEANVQKHQRDHHGIRFGGSHDVKKVIIAAMDNGEILNEIMPTDQEEDEMTRDEMTRDKTLEKDIQDLEQEFLDEFPLDIKDVVLTEQNLPEVSKISNVETQDNKAPDSTKPSSSNTTAEQGDEPPKQNPNIMTVIHSSSEKSVMEVHKPIIEPVDIKKEVKEVKSETPRISITNMNYRQIPANTNYFGLLKCTLNDCWFSTNEGYLFFEHLKEVHKYGEQNLVLDCAYCPFKTSKVEDMLFHVSTKHSMSRFQCCDCAYRSTLPGNVLIHTKFHHPNSESVKNIYECSEDISMLNEKPNNQITKMAENTASLKCGYCRLSFYAISHLTNHIRNEHQINLKTTDLKLYNELQCPHCKEQSNSKEIMQVHLALQHPDEYGYVIQRKLKNNTCVDAAKNLRLVNISLPISKTDVNLISLNNCDMKPSSKRKNNQSSLKDESVTKCASPPSTSAKSTSDLGDAATINEPDLTVVDDSSEPRSSSQVPIGNLTEEEKRLKPLLELFTENTGPPAATLYRCPECVASFLHYELWRKHIETRHKISHTLTCPYCTKQLSVELAAIHFESHRRHEYICFHCVSSFCSRAKIIEHFASFHSFKATIQKKIVYGDVSYSIFKEKDVSLEAVDWLALFQKLYSMIRERLIEKLQQNQHAQWLGGLSAACFAELDNMELPSYIVNDLPRFKCLCKSCPYVGEDENSLDLHMMQHPKPDKYKCSSCCIQQNQPTWQSIKFHKFLHKEEIHICCVCKFYHYSSEGMSEHIQQLHNYRDVPVLKLWRFASNYKVALSIVLVEKKMTFTTTENCHCCLEKLKSKLIHHLKKEHKITLCPKCVNCDEVLLTHIDAEDHAKEHGTKPFRLRYEILTPFLYQVALNCISPFNIETRLIKEKRLSDNFSMNPTKRFKKPDEEVPIKIKEEVVVKQECEEIAADGPSVSIKCVNLENLMENQTNSAGTCVISSPSISVVNLQNLQGVPVQNAPITQGYVTSNTSLTNSLGTMLPQNICPPSPMNIQVFPQSLQSQNQISMNLGKQNSQFITNQQQHHQQLQQHQQQQLQLQQQQQQQQFTFPSNATCLFIRELSPICGNCNLECSDFANLKYHFESMHSFKKERFLYRLSRKARCVVCSAEGSLHSLSIHHKANHSERMAVWSSVLDPNRCGICDVNFTSSPLANPLNPSPCACPRRQRTLADCLDTKTLKLLFNFGHNYFNYKCEYCKTSFNNEQNCSQHIVRVHKKASNPKLMCLDKLFVCYTCQETNVLIEKIIEHIHKIHLNSLKEISVDVISSIYRKIKIIYPKGLIICAGDLQNTRQCHDVDSFKFTLRNSDKI